MKKLLILFLVLIKCNSCIPQDKFIKFATTFRPIDLPIENIWALSNKDSLDGKQTNDLIIRGQAESPKFVNKSGKLKIVANYYGLYPEEPDSYLKDIKGKNDSWEEKRFFFFPKVIPIGRISLDTQFNTFIIKVIGLETTFYDLWNFSKDGKALSVVCLFWGMRDAGPRDEKVTFIIVDSKITKEGDIVWHENADGLETFRTYKLNSNGYFQIVKEETKGETEF
jgi:hypothetical protein